MSFAIESYACNAKFKINIFLEQELKRIHFKF